MSSENEIHCKCCSCLTMWHLGVNSAVMSWESAARQMRGGLKRKFAEEGGSKEAAAFADAMVDQIVSKVDIITPASEEEANAPALKAQLADVVLAKKQRQRRKWQCTKCGKEQDYVW